VKLWVGKKERRITNTQSDLEYAVVADRLTKKFGKFVAVDHISFKVKRVSIWFPWAEWRRKVDDHSNALRTSFTDRRHGEC